MCLGRYGAFGLGAENIIERIDLSDHTSPRHSVYVEWKTDRGSRKEGKCMM
jgi:hypothetical protein